MDSTLSLAVTILSQHNFMTIQLFVLINCYRSNGLKAQAVDSSYTFTGSCCQEFLQQMGKSVLKGHEGLDSGSFLPLCQTPPYTARSLDSSLCIPTCTTVRPALQAESSPTSWHPAFSLHSHFPNKSFPYLIPSWSLLLV